MKKVLSAVIIIVALAVSYSPALASGNQETEINASYLRFCEYITQNNILADVDYDVYADGFLNSGYATIEEYETAFEAQFNSGTNPSLRSSGGTPYYYNTGTSCPSSAVYSNTTYNLLNTLQAGDLVFENAGGPSGLTNHIAIVEGKFYDSAKQKYYIRLVEAIDAGVVRSILDDTRFYDRQGTVVRVTATSSQKSSAVSFAVEELGSTYLYDGAWNTSSSETNWYCSELAYASYYSAGKTLATGSLTSLPGVLPTDILNSSLVSTVLTYY
jgi:hypothetical protein